MTGRRSVTITDLAAAAGVSKSTVSLALQGSPRLRPGTIAKVAAVAKQLGYVYNRQAADLRRMASNIVGVVINDLSNPFFVELLTGIERRLAAAGYTTLMSHTGERTDVQASVLGSMREYHAAGFILCPALGTPNTLPREVRAWGVPLVIAMRPIRGVAHDYVGCDYVAGMATATAHLLDLGHRRIALLGPRAAGAVYDLRRDGYLQALAEAGVAAADELQIDVTPNRAGGRAGIRRALALAEPPSAVVCHNDVVAIGALGELGERGIEAGREFSVLGFDGIEAGAYTNPSLTTMNNQPAELGETAAGMLLERLDRPAARTFRHLALPTLVQRKSAGQLKP